MIILKLLFSIIISLSLLFCDQIELIKKKQPTGVFFVSDHMIVDIDLLKSGQLAGVTAFKASKTHPLYQTTDGVLYSKDTETIIAYPTGNDRIRFELPATVKTIGSFAFYNSNLLYFSFSSLWDNSCTAVMDNAFSGCTLLRQICLPGTIEYIGQNAFAGCSKDCVFISEQDSYANL